MKLIHTADLHLSSSLSSLLNKDKQSKIMFNTFKRLIDYSKENDINHILISGDLFDTPYPDINIVNDLLYLIESNPNITFYYLRGNHDEGFEFNKQIDNLKLFNNTFKKYYINNICISGIEHSNNLYNQIDLDINYINILMLHGTIDTKSDSYYLDKKELISKNPNYIALGHLHKTIMTEENNIIINNPGCLEPHGFDELGDNGFIIIDINEDNEKISSKFINFSETRFERVNLDISNINSILEIKDLILNKYQPNDNLYIEISLIGESNLINNKLLNELNLELSNKYQYIKVSNNTSPIFDYNDYINRNDIIGITIRNIMNKDYDEDTKKKMCLETIKYLNGGK